MRSKQDAIKRWGKVSAQLRNPAATCTPLSQNTRCAAQRMTWFESTEFDQMLESDTTYSSVVCALKEKVDPSQRPHESTRSFSSPLCSCLSTNQGDNVLRPREHMRCASLNPALFKFMKAYALSLNLNLTDGWGHQNTAPNSCDMPQLKYDSRCWVLFRYLSHEKRGLYRDLQLPLGDDPDTTLTLWHQLMMWSMLTDAFEKSCSSAVSDHMKTHPPTLLKWSQNIPVTETTILHIWSKQQSAILLLGWILSRKVLQIHVLHQSSNRHVITNKYKFDVYFDFLGGSVSHPLTWRKWYLWHMLDPANKTCWLHSWSAVKTSVFYIESIPLQHWWRILETQVTWQEDPRTQSPTPPKETQRNTDLYRQSFQKMQRPCRLQRCQVL